MKLSIMLAVAFSMGLISTNVMASESHEKMYLIQMMNQLDALKPLVVSASKEQDRNARIKFHYTTYRDSNGKIHNGLLEDINELRKGIQEKLTQPISEPRYFQSIKGDYLDMKNVKGSHNAS
jgi:RAQPRD family integrative conjugative element protein